MGKAMQVAWKRWGIINDIMGDVLASVVTTIFYFTVLVPFGIGVRLFSDPLQTKSASTQWLDRTEVSSTLDDARRQF